MPSKRTTQIASLRGRAYSSYCLQKSPALCARKTNHQHFGERYAGGDARLLSLSIRGLRLLRPSDTAASFKNPRFLGLLSGSQGFRSYQTADQPRDNPITVQNRDTTCVQKSSRPERGAWRAPFSSSIARVELLRDIAGSASGLEVTCAGRSRESTRHTRHEQHRSKDSDFHCVSPFISVGPAPTFFRRRSLNALESDTLDETAFHPSLGMRP
jgi:hypothetical protein